MSADLALRQLLNPLSHRLARVRPTRPLVNAARGNSQNNAQTERTARIAGDERPKPVVPRDHVPDLKQEQLSAQLSFWPNLHENREKPVFIGDVEHNPDPVTEFVRERLKLAEKEGDRGTVQKIERDSRLGPGHVFRIKDDDRARITSRTAQALAPVLGYPDYGDFLQAVVTWWKEEGQKRIGAWAFADYPEIANDAELKVAIEMAKGGGGTVPEIVADALKAHRSQIGAKHDRFWWIAQFGESARQWQKRQGEHVAEKKRTTKAQRELARARKEAPESSRALAGEQAEERKTTPTKRRVAAK